MAGGKVKCIDWSEIIWDLERAGFTQRQIGARCGFGDSAGWRNGGNKGSGGSWVNNLKNIPGTQPKFHQGALLLALWAEVTKREMAELPRADQAVMDRSGMVRAMPVCESVGAVRTLDYDDEP